MRIDFRGEFVAFGEIGRKKKSFIPKCIGDSQWSLA
jgi:hypothetical protein